MELYIDLQVASESEDSLPSIDEMQIWVSKAIVSGSTAPREEAELTVRIVDKAESQQLNNDYRGKNSATNVLSFPFENPPGITLPLIGDLVICKQVVENEAIEQHKTLQSHWAHMLIHGTLHLLGYDHIIETDAVEMESLETQLLIELGFSDPYNEQ